MDAEERELRAVADSYRAARPTWAQTRSYLSGRAAYWDRLADVAALAGLDLSDLYAPTPGDAVALRCGVLVEAEAWGLLAFDEAKFEAAELNAQRIAMRDPARAARIRDLVGRMRAATVAHVEREAGL